MHFLMKNFIFSKTTVFTMNYALFFKNNSFCNELYTVRLGVILRHFWHREGSMAELSRAEPSRAEPGRAEPSRAERKKVRIGRLAGRLAGWLAWPWLAGPGWLASLALDGWGRNTNPRPRYSLCVRNNSDLGRKSTSGSKHVHFGKKRILGCANGTFAALRRLIGNPRGT